jgi:hypothetical protein
MKDQLKPEDSGLARILVLEHLDQRASSVSVRIVHSLIWSIIEFNHRLRPLMRQPRLTQLHSLTVYIKIGLKN